MEDRAILPSSIQHSLFSIQHFLIMTVRYKLVLAYRGSRYHGWQKQPAQPSYKGKLPAPGNGIPTIQEVLSRALSSVLGHPVAPVGSSRTDAGVHAKGQVVHFDTDKVQVPPEGLRRAVNHRLPDDILIRSILAVPDTFDAIRSTTGKRYQYVVWHSADRPLFFSDLAWHRWQHIDVDAIRQAAALLTGAHDFASFAKPGHGRETTVRLVRECSISYRPPRLVFGVEGSGFLWNMVRIMVGTLVEVGLGRFTPADVAGMLAARDRRSAGSTAPPHGLYLHWIKGNAEC
jgi:tRNA pseudouridine38-40 synthase